MSIRIGINNYANFNQFIERIRQELPEDVELIVTNELFHELERVIKRIESEEYVDVFVSSGANADYMEKYLHKIPLVRIRVTGFDVLEAVREARNFSDHIAIISRHDFPQLKEMEGLLNVNLRYVEYSSLEELNLQLQALYAEGIRDVIGSALVLDQAKLFNMRGHFIYSMDSVRYAIQQAISLAKARKEILEKAKLLDYLMDYAAEGIMITDRNGVITHFNNSAELITGRKRARVLGKNCEDVLPNGQMLTVMKEKRPQYNRVQNIGNTKIVTNRSPLIVKKEVIGALATFFSVNTIKQAGESIRLSQNNDTAAKQYFEELVAVDPVMQNLSLQAQKYARTTSAILLSGESGTGKTSFAQCIHNASMRKNEAFIMLDCAACHPNMMETELFGIEDTKKHSIGCAERATGGTLFLKNIDSLSLILQRKLLRALEERVFYRVNSDRSIPLDVRLIASVNGDPNALLKKDAILMDLYYRISVLTLKLPPLRERKEDLPLLIRRALMQTQTDLSGRDLKEICSLPIFLKNSWPGNIRQLQSTMECFAILYSSGKSAEKAAEKSLEAASFIVQAPDPATELQEEIKEALRLAKGKHAKAAEILGMSRTTLWRHMKEYDNE